MTQIISTVPISQHPPAGKAERQQTQVDQAAREFEAMFISEMMKPMFEDISVEAPFGGGKGEEVFRGFLLQEYGKIIADRGGFGLSDSVRAQMILMQNAKTASAQSSITSPLTLPPSVTENAHETQTKK